ncbi:tetratricopeptide repeat-containing sulfotransferase family protein [Dyella silvatica]|uniref:tetratricopeptide repeat-containing sulfotransferase family protein n=1 Tax=Dyella silvatica TaxID=2992128 RepID=UPI002257A025|nr:sulfotransferase [Dyella silvatica]
MRMLAEAGQALSRIRPDDAERALTGVLALVPDSADANRLMGIACLMRADHQRAVDFLGRALAHCPDDAMIHMNLGSALYDLGATDDALSHLRRACALAPQIAAPWYNLGKALKLQVQTEEASRALKQALAMDPAHILARIALADAQTSMGDIPAAIAHYREILRRQPENPDAWHALANLKTERLSAEDAKRLRQAFRQPGASPDARISLGFALAKALEDQHDYPTAFEALREANALKRRQVNWDAAAEQARVDAIMQAFAGQAPEPVDATLGQEVILIVSLPRSGSTLTEQILASHPQVEGANEITDLPQVIDDESKRRGLPFPQWVNAATPEDWARLGRDYLARTARWRQQRPRFTDKNLVNWQLVGAALRMLPGARVVNSRRDALETCCACYRQLFSNSAHFSYDLDDMARHYQDYDRLSRYWQQQMPKQVLDHSYEALLADTEAQIRRLLDFCGLDFDPACLTPHQTSRTVLSTASAAQVRQPLRAETSYSARYAEKLDPLRARLQGMGLR